MKSIRQLAIDVINTRLATITQANGYSRDILPDQIYSLRESLGGLPTPALLVLQNDEEVVKQYSDLYECILEFDIGFVDSGAYLDPSDEANKFLADIQKAVGIEYVIQAPRANLNDDDGNPVISNVTVQLRELGSAITVTDSIPTFLMGRVTYKMTYRRNQSDPSKA